MIHNTYELKHTFEVRGTVFGLKLERKSQLIRWHLSSLSIRWMNTLFFVEVRSSHNMLCMQIRVWFSHKVDNHLTGRKFDVGSINYPIQTAFVTMAGHTSFSFQLTLSPLMLVNSSHLIQSFLFFWWTICRSDLSRKVRESCLQFFVCFVQSLLRDNVTVTSPWGLPRRLIYCEVDIL